jgi:Arc/MetJ-type ribon-helix-helix transcriptional regulator
MVQLSTEFEAEIRRKAAAGAFPTLEDFLRNAVEAFERERSLEALLLEGLDSGEAPLTEQDFDDIRREGLEEIRRLRNEQA